jgi:hypothetical protein
MGNKLSSVSIEQANTVTITLSGNWDDPDVSVDPHELFVKGNYILIRFMLINEFHVREGEGRLEYQFPETGAIVMTSTAAQFPLISLAEKPKDPETIRRYAKIFDFNTDVDSYDYNITVCKVERLGGTPIPRILRLVIDPIIQNGQE